jgi:hypothetical protein
MDIYTTHDSGKLHIAIDNNYLGSVNTYNNFFTRFFAGLFNTSMEIIINNKKRIVNISSYRKLLKKVNKNLIPSECKNFNEVAPLKITDSYSLMNFHLSKKKRRELFRKLVYALVNEEIEKARKLVGKGANLKDKFWIMNGVVHFQEPITIFTNYGFFFSHENKKEEFAQYTPLIYASSHPNIKELAHYMKDFDVDITQMGEHKQLMHQVKKKKMSEDYKTIKEDVWDHYERGPDKKIRNVYKKEECLYHLTTYQYNYTNTVKTQAVHVDNHLHVTYDPIHTNTKHAEEILTEKERVN